MAIQIYCDLCGMQKEVNQIKGVEQGATGAVVFTAPRFDHKHFACDECLAKIGVTGSAISANGGHGGHCGQSAGTGAAGQEDQGASVKFRKARRRGVEVIVLWKADGGFEVFNSIAAAVDRIAAKTGVVVTGADISHALLKERIYNADVFCVKYASETQGTANRTDGTDAARKTGGTERMITDGNGMERSAGAEDDGAWFASEVSTAANAEKAAGE